MGNGNSCSCISTSNSIRARVLRNKNGDQITKTAVLVDTNGKVREIKLPVKSGELMIDQIGHVIAPADDLLRTRRISALPADQDLLPGKAYLLVAASRVHCKPSASEIQIAEAKKTVRNAARVSPAPVPKLSEGESEVFDLGWPSKPWIGNQTRWAPLLDPISESPEFNLPNISTTSSY